MNSYNEAIRLDPKYAAAYYNRGYVWAVKKEYERAIADFNEAIRLDPKHAKACHNRAWLWATCPDERFRDGKKAVASATQACELTEWKSALELVALAAAYAETGEFDQAVQWQEKANRLFTDEEMKGAPKFLDLYRTKTPYRAER